MTIVGNNQFYLNTHNSIRKHEETWPDLSQVHNFILELIEELVPNACAEFVARIGNCTGFQWRPIRKELFWFQSPALHVFSFAVIVLWLCPILRIFSKNFYSKFKESCEIHERSLPRCNRLIRISASFIFALCIIGQVYLKSKREAPFIQLGWMLMPCHVESCVWLYILLTCSRNNYSTNSYLITMLIDYYWAPILAMTFPDTGDHLYKAESYIFVIEHSILLILPFYAALHFTIAPITWSHFCHSALVSLFIAFAIYTPFSLLTGLNLNYMLYPPLVSSQGVLRTHINAPWFLQTPLYRFYVSSLLICSSVLSNVMIRSTVYFSKLIKAYSNYGIWCLLFRETAEAKK